MLRSEQKKCDPHLTSQPFSLQKLALHDMFSLLHWACLVWMAYGDGAYGWSIKHVWEDRKCCLGKRINIDGKNRKSLEVCIRSVWVVEWRICLRMHCLPMPWLKKGTIKYLSGVTNKERSHGLYHRILIFPFPCFWNYAANREELFKALVTIASGVCRN